MFNPLNAQTMKKHLLFVASALVAFAGCSVESIKLVEPEENLVTIKATIDGNDTKATYTEDTEHMKAITSWSVDDQIKVLYSNGSGEDYSSKTFTTTAGDGVFTGTPGTAEGGAYAHMAMYPATCGSMYKSGDRESLNITIPEVVDGDGSNIIPMLAYHLNADFDGTYHFQHPGSVIRFKFTNIPSTARKLVISSTDEDLAGLYYISYNEGVFKYTTGTNGDGDQRSITYNFTPNVDGTYTFYLPFGVATPWFNFTFTFKDSKNDAICTRTTTLTGLTSTVLQRNTMYRVKMNVMKFPGYPFKTVTINPSNVPTTPGTFTISPIGFTSVSAYYNASTEIRFDGTADGSARIYNTTSLGAIYKIEVTKGTATSYYRDNYDLYAGTSADPYTTEIDYSEYDGLDAEQVSTTYYLIGGDYSYFAIRNHAAYYDNMGTITVYYRN